MAVLHDSSILVALSIDRHPAHEAVEQWAVTSIQDTVLIASAHALCEVYNTLTRTGAGWFALPPSRARAIITRYRKTLRIVSLSVTDYMRLFERAEELDIVGPQVYDLLHAEAARKAGAEQIATINTRHFRPMWPSEQLVDPTTA